MPIEPSLDVAGIVQAMDAEASLRDARLRVTAPRLAVLKALDGNPHSEAKSVLHRVLGELPSTSLQAVYNVLADLTVAGLVRKIEPAGQPGLYELRVGDNHHHLVCTTCGTVVDVDCAVGHAPCLTPQHASGFAVDEAEVTFWGTCADCQQVAQVPA